LVLNPGQSVSYGGHRFTYVGSRRFALPNKSGEVATVLVDGAPFRPAISVFPGSEGVGTPAVDSSVREDTYLTLANVELPSGPATIDVVIQPLVMWLWVGGTITAFGAVLAAIPGRRRRGRREERPASSGQDKPPADGLLPKVHVAVGAEGLLAAGTAPVAAGTGL
jgi:cytochrome c-type biogenesis protein CcmF